MPSITIWNRMEPRARSQDMKAGLEARVHDPLWLLARQWQVGEFAGRDAGSPVMVEVKSTATAFDRYTTGAEAARPYDGRVPLEVLVEREAVRPQQAASDLRQAAEAGLQFFRMLDAASLAAATLARLRAAYLRQYALAAPSATDTNSQPISAIVAGRVIDGIKLHADLVAAGSALPAQPVLSNADRQTALPIALAWRAWYESLFSEPAGADSWSPDRMEYRFTLGSASGSTQCIAREYDGGAADWYTFDRSSATPVAGSTQPAVQTRRAMAAPVTFRGMPARRFWEMEDAAVDIGALSAAAEDIGRLLLREFGLIYGNDWFQIPLAVPVGSEVNINSLAVTDTFGLTTTIPHYTEVDGAAGGWRMFALAAETPNAALASARVLVVTPGAVAPTDGAAIEDVLLLRDELANMVWGVERTAVGPAGTPVDRALAWKTAAPPVTLPAAGAPLSYRLGSTVPDYWIPFLPVAVNNVPVQMRLGQMPTAPRGAMGRLLGYQNLTIFLEELPREGVHLERRYRAARGPDGSTHVWIGRRRSTGRGEGRSGLRFDYLE
jgi:hypothetical protein